MKENCGICQKPKHEHTHTSDSHRIVRTTDSIAKLIQQQPLAAKPGNLPSAKLLEQSREEAGGTKGSFPVSLVPVSPVCRPVHTCLYN